MFLRILYFIVSVIVSAALMYALFATLEKLVIVPRVCKYSVGIGQRYLIANGRGFFEPPVKKAISTENYKRTTRLVQIDLLFAILAGICIPSGLKFWIVPEWSIKIGAVLGILLDTFVSFIACGNTDSQVGLLEQVDREEGKLFFRGNWMSDFVVEFHERLDDEDCGKIGHTYIVLDYPGCFCSVSLDPET